MDERPHVESQARMVDVGAKPVTDRHAIARGTVQMNEKTRVAITERRLSKGDVLEVARVAGIMAAKRTSELIPLCHPIGISSVSIDLEAAAGGIEITARVSTSDRTGVEMEALTAVAVAGLTVYDMVKGIERGVRLTDVRLVGKSGGASGDYRAS
ncbi:MAG: cyclic pyranopterin monophosphate synthase MoaC [Actinomycetota bacterium]|nr:cyclic pyranopterin monophosphate synthase MoaC [Actinomycetota bacterium]